MKSTSNELPMFEEATLKMYKNLIYEKAASLPRINYK